MKYWRYFADPSFFVASFTDFTWVWARGLIHFSLLKAKTANGFIFDILNEILLDLLDFFFIEFLNFAHRTIFVWVDLQIKVFQSWEMFGNNLEVS